MTKIAYSASRDDLFFPCTRGNFFPDGLPESDAALCAEMCRLAYCEKSPGFASDQDKIKAELAKIGFAGALFFETQSSGSTGGTHALFAHNPKANRAVLAFRGTDKEDPSDLWDDADLQLIPWKINGIPSGRVHGGFSRAFTEVQTQLDVVPRGLTSRLLVTGHSLGAAIATLVVSSWYPDLKDRLDLYTVGSPLVGDAQFVSTVPEEISHRYVDCCDAVTSVPPEALGYRHIGDPMYIDRNGGIAVNPSESVIRSDRSAAREDYILHHFWKKGTVQARELADHAPINYVSAISGTRS